MGVVDIRKEVHDEIDRMTEEEIVGVKEFLAEFPNEFRAFLRTVPAVDDPLSEEELEVLAEADEWFRQNGGKGIPHEEVMRDLGLE